MTLLLGQWVGIVFRVTHVSIANTMAMQDVIAIQDLLKIDFMQAPGKASQWSHYANTLLRWTRYDNKSIEWSIEHGQCIRKEGVCDKNGGWITVQKSIVGGEIVQGEFHVSMDNKNHCVQKIDFLFKTSLQNYVFTYYLQG